MSAIDLQSLGAGGSVPKALFGYDVVDFLGEGAGSSIYVVSDPRTHQIYALKHVLRKTDKHARFIEQLENEYAVSHTFAHRALRKSIDMKQTKTWLGKVTEAALVMELFDGLPMDVHPPKTVAQAVDIFVQTAQGLEALHAAGQVHCDLKPNNILVGPDGSVKVIDFGQACKAGTVKERIQGTPDYIAPEQVKREAVTIRTDVFNLGATMYWALSGKKIPTLFTIKKDANSFILHDKIETPADLNKDVPEPLSNLVMECIKTNPLKRPESMGTVTRRLEIIQHALHRRSAEQQGAPRVPVS
ncbi:MAG TPA: serine/threonine-protein kinase [Tepidisphaeraceae bacterium]|jgi:serine/threonine-protein kinase